MIKTNKVLKIAEVFTQPLWFTLYWLIFLGPIGILIVLILFSLMLIGFITKKVIVIKSNPKEKLNSLQKIEISLWSSQKLSELIHYYQDNMNIWIEDFKLLVHDPHIQGMTLGKIRASLESTMSSFFKNKMDLANNLQLGLESWEKKDVNASLRYFKGLLDCWKRYKDFYFPNNPKYIRSNYAVQERKIKNKILNIIDKAYKIEPKLNDLENYKKYLNDIEAFIKALNHNKFNLAFKYYFLIEGHKKKIIHKAHLLNVEKETFLKIKFGELMLNMTTIIKNTILDLSIKYTRLNLDEISEKCSISNTNLIREVIRKMIKYQEIYGEYFESTNSIVFDQQTNLDSIDSLMEKYKKWEKEEKDKI